MLKIVIPTTPPDSDALLIAAAIRQRGHICELLYTSDYPSISRQTLRYSNQGTSVEFAGQSDCPKDWRFDICWLRDLHPPLIDFDIVHPADKAFVQHVNQQYYLQHWALLASDELQSAPAFWANSLEAARRAESKPLQLHLARLAGFSVPDTIVSNDPDEIRNFLDRREKTYIRKSLVPHFWNERDKGVTNKTSHITLDDLPSDRILSVHAEIFQEEIDKLAEVRVVFFGATYFALRIQPEQQKASRFVDWRVYHFAGMSPLEPITLPEDVSESCRRLMKMLGIVTASFDLLIDKQGHYHFAELNQGGLFLWMENHGQPVLQAFVDFLLARETGFQFEWPLTKNCLRLADIHNSEAVRALAETENSHLTPPQRMVTNISGTKEERIDVWNA